MTWENNFSNEYGRFKMSEDDEKEFSLPWMEIPKGGVKPVMGTNQWFRNFLQEIKKLDFLFLLSAEFYLLLLRKRKKELLVQLVVTKATKV